MRASEQAAQDEAANNIAEASKARFLKKYQAKVREEYFFRAEGNAIAADFALPQLAMMEADAVAGQARVHMQGSYRERKGAEAEWRATRPDGSARPEGGEKPEGDSFLPGG